MEELQKQIDELKNRLDQLSNSAFIPYEVEQAFKTRLSPLKGEATGTYDDIVTTVTIGAGGGSFDQLDVPDGYVLIKFNENNYKIPYYLDV